MYPAFRFILVLVSLSFFTGTLRAHDETMQEMDPMSLFHESESRVEVVAERVLQSAADDILFAIYVVNTHGEPAHEPFQVKIGYQFESENFRKLVLPEGARYCDVGEPRLVERDAFAEQIGQDLSQQEPDEPFYEPGEYLIVPVHNFNGETLDCPVQSTEVEAFWVDGLRRIHQSDADVESDRD